jgi:hypothetical protein
LGAGQEEDQRKAGVTPRPVQSVFFSAGRQG